MPRFLPFFRNSVSTGAGFAIGHATAPTISPLLQDLQNETWALHPSVPLDVVILADGVASGEITLTDALAEAELTGYNGDRFRQLVDVVDTGPGVGQAFRLWRRGLINEAGFRRALKRASIEDEWIDDLVKTKTEPLDVAVIANAIQQGFIPGDGILAGDAGGSAPYTPPVEQVDIDGSEEAAWSGVPSAHLRVLAQLSGNPPGPEKLLEMWRKGIITEEAVNRGLREGRTKTKWTSAIKANRFALLTGIQAVNLWLRGWIGRAEALEHGEKLGYTPDLMDLLYKGQGRPLSMRQAFIGHERGGVYDGPTDAIPDYFLTMLRQSSIRPEWYNLAWAQRYTMPSAFVLRALTQDGTFTAQQATSILVDSGWVPAYAAQAAAKWAGGAADEERDLTATDLRAEFEANLLSEADYRRELTELGYSSEAADAKVRLAGTRLRVQARKQRIGRIHSSFVGHRIQRADAERELAEAGIAAAQVPLVLDEWQQEADVNVSRLTAAELRKAYKKANLTREQAFDRLLELRYSEAEANTYLDNA